MKFLNLNRTYGNIRWGIRNDVVYLIIASFKNYKMYMNPMRKLFVYLVLFLSLSVSAQYVNSIGVRGGLRGVGLSYKHFLAPKLFLVTDAVGSYSQELQGGELIATLNIRNKIHNANLQSKSVTWSYGFGVHSGYYRDPDNTNNESSFILGPDVRLGAEYLFAETWCFGIDATGMYNVMPLQKVTGMDNKFSQVFGAGVFIRYIIQ